MIPTSTNVTVEVAAKVPAKTEAVAVLLRGQEKKYSNRSDGLDNEELEAIRRLIDSGLARGKAKEVAIAVAGGKVALRRVLVVGVGSPEKGNAEALRIAGGALAKAARKHRIHGLTLFVPSFLPGIPPGSVIEPLVTGFLLASFKYEEYKGVVSKKKRGEDEEPQGTRLTLIVEADQVKTAREELTRARIAADGQNFARTIASRPGNDVHPVELARVARRMAHEVGLDCRVLDEKQMAKLGMGGILAVGAGSSATPPRMIVLEHNVRLNQKSKIKSQKSPPPLLVVGKAITFDTGGISIKPAEKMGKMIFDKSGGMAVLGLMYAVAKLKLPIPVVGILSSAENHISATAYRPGDILQMYNGVTVEVTNTDAEGRLVLGDALAWGIETYKPAAVLDLATLTGGVIVALGHTMAGVMANNDELFGELQTAADSAGEKIWRLPLGDDQRDLIKSDYADIVNSAGRFAHPLQGGAFLSHFVPEKTPWAHLDIAGVADTEKELPYYAKGSTAWGVRTLVEWVMRRIRSV